MRQRNRIPEELLAPVDPTAPDGDSEQESPSGGSLGKEIAQRAYRHYEERGCVDGHDVEDWLRAEEEIGRERSETGSDNDQ